MWLHGAGNNDLLRRTSGCCETHLLFWHSGRSAGIPNTLLTYAMTYASDEDIETLKKYFSDDEFKAALDDPAPGILDRKSTRLNSSHGYISYAVFCLKNKTTADRCNPALKTARIWSLTQPRSPSLSSHAISACLGRVLIATYRTRDVHSLRTATKEGL